jgi:hypothetical protein
VANFTLTGASSQSLIGKHNWDYFKGLGERFDLEVATNQVYPLVEIPVAPTKVRKSGGSCRVVENS